MRTDPLIGLSCVKIFANVLQPQLLLVRAEPHLLLLAVTGLDEICADRAQSWNGGTLVGSQKRIAN